jgi:vacuolar protein sorting-associated protein 13A/C
MGGDVESCLQALEDPHSSQTDLHLLERINLSFVVQNAIINVPNLTRFKIAGDLPDLQVNFSDQRYKTLMRFIDVSVPHFPDDNQTTSVVNNGLTSFSSLPAKRPVEEYNLDDARSIISTVVDETRGGVSSSDEKDDTGSMDDKGNDLFFEAPDDTTESQRRAMQQITFQFSFNVGRLKTSLFRSVSATEEHPLANATLEGFGFTFALRQFDMSVDLFLRSVTLAMAEHSACSKRPLLSSAESTGQNDQARRLLQVRYCRVQKESPEFMTVHEGVDQSVDVELSTFDITIAPEPILALYDWILTTFTSREDLVSRQPSSLDLPSTATDADTVVEGGAEEQPKNTDKIRVRVKLTSAQGKLQCVRG